MGISLRSGNLRYFIVCTPQVVFLGEFELSLVTLLEEGRKKRQVEKLMRWWKYKIELCLYLVGLVC
jgi:hypothetical protein